MMRSRLRLPLLFVAILVPCAALAMLGVISIAGDAGQVARRYRERSEGALETAAAAVRATADALPEGVPGAIGFIASELGALSSPASESRPAPTQDDGSAGDLLLLVFAEVDRFERTGDLVKASERLRGFIASGPQTELAAAALTALAAVEKKAGRADAARAAWTEIVARHPDARDPRGLKRSFAARLALDDPGDLEALFHDVARDDVDPARPATAAFRRDVRARVAASGAGVADVDAQDRAMVPLRQLRAAFAAGAEDWIRRGGRGSRTFAVAPETLAALEENADAITVVVTARSAPGESAVTGGAASLAGVIATALGRPDVRALETVGFPVAIAAGTAGAAEPRLALGDTLGGATLAVRGVDFETFRKQDRSRFWWTVALATLGLVVATIAATATTRAVRRDVRVAQERENFVAAVTHELKTPLASIRLMAEVLARGGVGEAKVREFADRAIGECDRLARLVTSVLELSRIEGERGRLPTAAAVDANAIAREVVDAFAPVAQKQGFTVSLRAGPGDQRVRGERDALVGALMNLLDNAVKYSETPGEIELEVVSAGTHQVAFAVLDRGRGVPAADVRRIFEPFARLGDEMTRDRPGVGLGLALVSRIAAAHGGSASCQSRDGGGSRFVIVLPRAGEAA